MYTVTASPDVRNPPLLISLSGWVDAGGAGTGAAEFLAEGSTPVALFDSDALYDYRANRPVLRIEDGLVDEVTWPALELRLRQWDGLDLLILSGMEPDFQWKRLASEVAGLANNLNVSRVVTMGAVPAAVPHTLPVPILSTASDDTLLLEGDEQLTGTLVVPGAAISIITNALIASGLPTIGYWAQVPHYVRDSYHPAIAALARRVGAQLSTSVDTADLDARAGEQVANLDEIVAGRPEAAAYVESLERMVGQGLPSADEIGAEVERFLMDQGDGTGPFD